MTKLTTTVALFRWWTP